MKKLLFIVAGFVLSLTAVSQPKPYTFSASGGEFFVGKANVQGVWLGVGFEKRLRKKNSQELNRFAISPEFFFEHGASKATVVNPTANDFMHTWFEHESNSGVSARVIFYPFRKGLAQGFNVSAAPLLVYSIRTRETRAELIQYLPTYSVRMVQMTNDNALLGGWRLTFGYDFYFLENWLLGVRADFVNYAGRDLNSMLGVRVGWRM